MGVEGTDQTSVNGSGENLNKLPPPNGTTDQVEDSKPDPSVIVSKPTPLFDIDDVLKKMGAVDKITLLSGKDGWHTRDILRFKIPSMRLSDGPNGVRGTQFFNGTESVCFPCATGLGSSFDVDLAFNVGQALGKEARQKSVHVLLGPTVNIQRSPLGGRGFESFSEDPHLNGTIAGGYINGVQSEKVVATIKHYVANEQEYQRFSMSSDVSERALREIYLKPFQIAIKASRPLALMTAYNRVNGLHVSEDKRILTGILKEEWGYEGMVMSDWTGVYSTTESIKAGLDLEMPGPTAVRGKAVQQALKIGKLTSKDVDHCARKVLELALYASASGILPDGLETPSKDTDHVELLRRAAADSIVLLKNENNVLPLSAESFSGKKIAVIGPNAKRAYTSGGGSAVLRSAHTVSPLEGIKAALEDHNVKVQNCDGVTGTSFKYLPLIDSLMKGFNDFSNYLEKLDNPTQEFKTNTEFNNAFDGKPGALIEFWNESPTDDFLKTDAAVGKKTPEPAWLTRTSSSNCFFSDGVDTTKVNKTAWVRYSTKFVPDDDGDWEFSLVVVGQGNLFVNQKLVVNLTEPESGELFFNVGSKEVRGVFPDLVKDREYNLEIRACNSNSFLDIKGTPFDSRGGIRIGAFRKKGKKEAIEEAVKVAEESVATILVVGLNNDTESEGFDRADMNLPEEMNELVWRVLAKVPDTVVVNQSGTPVTMPWISTAQTLLQAFYGGDELGNGLADIIFGKENPSGKLALTFPKRLEDNPSYGNFGVESPPNGKVSYNEGIFVGYRGYKGIRPNPGRKLPEPLFCFGYGLSYTTFVYSNLSVNNVTTSSKTTIDVRVTFEIRNTGDVKGKEAAQIYIAPPLGVEGPERPAKELKGFKKVSLEAGESIQVEIYLKRDAFSFYNEERKCWVVQKAAYGVFVGSSLEDLPLKKTVEIEKTIVWNGL